MAVSVFTQRLSIRRAAKGNQQLAIRPANHRRKSTIESLVLINNQVFDFRRLAWDSARKQGGWPGLAQPPAAKRRSHDEEIGDGGALQILLRGCGIAVVTFEA